MILHISDFYFHLLDLLQGTYTLRIVMTFFELLIIIAPYLVISMLVHVTLMQFVQKRGIRISTRNKLLTTVFGSLLGIVSPLPTYAALPIGISFIPLGVPVSAVMAFAIASPLMNPAVFFLTMTQLGADVAIARLVAAIGISICGGMIVGFTMKSIQTPLNINPKVKIKRSFFNEFKRTFSFLSKRFLFALFLSAVVKALISPEWIARILGQHVQHSLLIAIGLGVPFYSCGGAAIPFIEVLSEMGMNKGAVLAFFIAGPATKLETLYIYKSMLGIKIFFFYLILTVVGAFICGLIMLLR